MYVFHLAKDQQFHENLHLTTYILELHWVEIHHSKRNAYNRLHYNALLFMKKIEKLSDSIGLFLNTVML